MDHSSSDQWQYVDSPHQKPRLSNSPPSFWQQAQNLPQVATRHGYRAYQPTVEDAIDDTGIYYRPAHNLSYGRQPPFPDPYAWARSNSGPRSDIPLNSVRATTMMASRRSFVEPHANFSPPPLVSDSSTLSSASSNFSVPTPTFDQQPRRRSSQQAFPDQIDRDALARANKRMASDLADLSASPFHTDKYDPFAPLQPRAPFAAGTGLYTDQVASFQPFEARRESASSVHSPHRRLSHVHQSNTPAKVPAEDASAFKSHLNSELNRRAVADKTVSSIRSERARAVAQAKESARRTDWAKDVLLKFPVQCALAESLRPEDMMASITKSGVFELTASMA